jgi:hypothetical protein
MKEPSLRARVQRNLPLWYEQRMSITTDQAYMGWAPESDPLYDGPDYVIETPERSHEHSPRSAPIGRDFKIYATGCSEGSPHWYVSCLGPWSSYIAHERKKGWARRLWDVCSLAFFRHFGSWTALQGYVSGSSLEGLADAVIIDLAPCVHTFDITVASVSVLVIM